MHDERALRFSLLLQSSQSANFQGRVCGKDFLRSWALPPFSFRYYLASSLDTALADLSLPAFCWGFSRAASPSASPSRICRLILRIRPTTAFGGGGGLLGIPSTVSTGPYWTASVEIWLRKLDDPLQVHRYIRPQESAHSKLHLFFPTPLLVFRLSQGGPIVISISPASPFSKIRPLSNVTPLSSLGC